MRKCCVVGCNATNETHRLFNFPKNDKLRELWLSFLIPVNAMLSGLSKDQLISRYVCQKHFDRHQFDGTGNRLQHGYPSLFTSMEILHGVPLRSTADNDLSDHNYAKQPTVSQNPTDFILIPCTAASSSQTTSIVKIVSNKLTSKIDNDTALTPCAAASNSQTTSIVEIVSNKPISNIDGEPTDLIGNVEQIQIETPSNISNLNKGGNKMINRCRSFASSMTKMADNESNMQTPFSGDDARTISNNHLFSKQFGKLPKQAQDFLLMQLKMANRKKEAMRFTTNEKLLCLSLMKDSPQGWNCRDIGSTLKCMIYTSTAFAYKYKKQSIHRRYGFYSHNCHLGRHNNYCLCRYSCSGLCRQQKIQLRKRQNSSINSSTGLSFDSTRAIKA